MSNLNIYLLERKNDHIGYDEMRACIVVAKSESQARELANTAAFDEGEIWDVLASSTGRYVTCEVIGVSVNSETGVIMSDVLDG